MEVKTMENCESKIEVKNIDDGTRGAGEKVGDAEEEKERDEGWLHG